MKNIIVTGAGSGQGLEHASALIQSGAKVFAVDRQFSEKSENTLNHDLVEMICMDITDPEAWKSFCARLRRDSVRSIHGLVNNAGVLSRKGLGEIGLTEWKHVIETNLTGSYLGINHLLPFLIEARGASIINISSQAGLSGHYASAYSVSKWAVRGLTKVAAMEFGEHQIRTNCLIPGYIKTEMNQSTPQAFQDAQIANIPLGRAGIPQDVTSAVLFLLSEDSKFINGAEILIDGGQTSHGGFYGFRQFLEAGA